MKTIQKKKIVATSGAMIKAGNKIFWKELQDDEEGDTEAVIEEQEVTV